MSALTAAQSKKIVPVLRAEQHSALIAGGLSVTDGAQNVFAKILVEAGGSGQTTLASHECRMLVGFCAPTMADYTTAKTGDLYLELTTDTTDATPPARAALWICSAAGWEKFMSGGSATSGPSAGYQTYTGTDNKLIENRAIFSTAAGDNRVAYLRAQYTGTTAQGDVLRAYAEVKSTATSVHGIHATGQVSAGGSIVGEVVGIRATAAVVTGLTLTGGELVSLRLDSDLSSAVTGLTAAAYIGCYDVTSTKMPFFAYIDGSATGVIGATTGATAAGTLKVNVAGATRYIQLFSAAS